MPKPYYTQNGTYIRNPEAYAMTGAPMYTTRYGNSTNINQETDIYKLNLTNGKKYVGKTTDIDRRMEQHFIGHGAKVTQKFKPKNGKVVDSCPGFFADQLEQEHTEKYMDKYGYDNVRGGVYVNSKTLHKTEKTSSNANLLQRVKSRVQAKHRVSSNDVLIVPIDKTCVKRKI